MFPTQQQLETSAYEMSGDGKTNFSYLKKPASKYDSFNSLPDAEKWLGEYTLKPGTSSKIHEHECPAGQTVSIWMYGSGTYLNYFQDYNPCREYRASFKIHTRHIC